MSNDRQTSHIEASIFSGAAVLFACLTRFATVDDVSPAQIIASVGAAVFTLAAVWHLIIAVRKEEP